MIFLGVWEPTFLTLGSFFFEFLIPSILRGHNFFNSITFLTILKVPQAQQDGFKFCFDTRNNEALPLDLACPECLNVWFTLNLKPLAQE